MLIFDIDLKLYIDNTCYIIIKSRREKRRREEKLREAERDCVMYTNDLYHHPERRERENWMQNKEEAAAKFVYIYSFFSTLLN